MTDLGLLLRDRSRLPADDGWLGPAERRWLRGRRSANRIADWRLGRWTAKRAIAAFLQRQGQAAPLGVEVLAAADGAPEAFAGGRPLPLCLSLSHSEGRALCVVGAAGISLGCDLERIAPRSRAFVDSYFTAAETAALAAVDEAGRDLLANLIWSAKESALKALRRGLRADTRSVEVALACVSRQLTAARPAEKRRLAAAGVGPWQRLEVTARADGAVFAGRWRRLGELVATVVSRPPPGEIYELG